VNSWAGLRRELLAHPIEAVIEATGGAVDEIGQKNGIVGEPALVVADTTAIAHQEVLVPMAM
jgi:hypothetical protein